MLGCLCPPCQLAQKRSSRRIFDRSMDIAMRDWMYEDDPARRLIRHLRIDHETQSDIYQQKINEIIDAAQREHKTRDEARQDIEDFIKQIGYDVLDNYQKLMRNDWGWKQWPYILCTGYDEASMQTCMCSGCIHIRTERMRQEAEEVAYEQMMEELRERAADPFYKDWEVPE